METLTQHLEPKPIIIAERYKFHKAEQRESESIRDYLATLQRLAETCEFGGYREEAIRDRFVCGLKTRTIQRKLLGEAELTLKLAVEKACAAELTEKETSILHGDSVKRMESIKFPECFRCGKSNHAADKCFYRKSKCHGCQKFGYIVKRCPERSGNKSSNKQNFKTKREDKRKKKKPSGINQVAEDRRAEEDNTAWPLFTVSSSTQSCKELMVLVSIDGKPLNMEVDTGASVTIIPKKVWKEVLASKPVRVTDVKLRSYSGVPADLDPPQNGPPGPNPRANMDRGVHIH